MNEENGYRFWQIKSWRDAGNHSETDAVFSGDDPWNLTSRGPFSPANIGLEFSDPREVTGLEIMLDPPEIPPAGMKPYLEYWQLGWPPANRMSPGWETVDDAVHGIWRRADSSFEIRDNRIVLKFPGMTSREVSRYEGPESDYRQTLKVRAVFPDTETVTVKKIAPILRGTYEPLRVRVDWLFSAPGARKPEPGTPVTISLHNGIFPEGGISRTAKAEQTGLDIEVSYFSPRDGSRCASGDLPLLTLEWESRGFTVNLLDLVSEKKMWLPDFAALVRSAVNQTESPEEAVSSLVKPGTRLIEKIESMPEQTLERGRKEIPKLDKETHGQYVILGCEANRGEFACRYDGKIFLDRKQLKLRRGEEDLFRWPAQILSLDCGIGEKGPRKLPSRSFRQEFLEGWLPVLKTSWNQDELVSELECCATLLHPELGDTEDKNGQEPSFLAGRWKIRNNSSTEKKVTAWFLLKSGEHFGFRNGSLTAEGTTTAVEMLSYPRKFYDEPGIRLSLLNNPDRWMLDECVDSDSVTGVHQALSGQFVLAPGEEFIQDFIMPFESKWNSAEDWGFRYLRERERVESFWRKRIGECGSISGIDPDVDDFTKSVLWHVLLTADKHPETGRWHCGAATWCYEDFPNEAAVQSRWLDMIGDHKAAANILQPVVDSQGKGMAPGAYTSSEGAFYRSGEFNFGAYSLDHGWSLWALAEHYFLSGDREWLKGVADNLYAAAEFVRRERRTTMVEDDDGKPVIHYGLLPMGAIEDIQEWRYWFEVNILCWAGITKTAEAFEDIGDSRARELAELAREYGKDIRRSLERATVRSCAVPLQDGTWIPRVPSHAYSRYRDSGWIRECLESPLAKGATVGFFRSGDILLDWLLHDTEENRYRKPVTDLEQDPELWFSQEGFSKQPMLVDIPAAYLIRNQVKPAVRSFINSYLAIAYEDVRCLAEWIKVLGKGAGPLFKTPDECAWLSWLRTLFILEDEGLKLGWGIPEVWLKPGKKLIIQRMKTLYGPLSMIWEGGRDTLSVRLEAEVPDDFPVFLKARIPGSDSLQVSECIGGSAEPAGDEAGIFRITFTDRNLRIVFKNNE